MKRQWFLVHSAYVIAAGVFRPYRNKVTIKTSKIESKVEKVKAKEEKAGKNQNPHKKKARMPTRRKKLPLHLRRNQSCPNLMNNPVPAMSWNLKEQISTKEEAINLGLRNLAER